MDNGSQKKLENEYLSEIAKLKRSHRKEMKVYFISIILVIVIFFAGGLFMYQDAKNYYDNTLLIDKSYELKESIIDKLQKHTTTVTSVEIIKKEYSQPIYIINCTNNSGEKFIISKSENEISVNKTLATDKKEYVEYKFLKTEKLLPLEYKKTIFYDTDKLKNLIEKDSLDVVKSGYYKVVLFLHK